MNGAATAVTVIDFDGTSGIAGATLGDTSFPAVVGNTVNVGGDPSIGDRRGFFSRLAAGTPLVGSAAYAGPDVYGAYESIAYDVATGNIINTQRLVEANANDVYLRSAFNTSTGFAGAMASSFYYFRTGAAGVAFDATSQLSITTKSMQFLTGRWVVNDGGTYYISSNTFTGSATLADPNSTTWALFSPTGSLLNFNQSAATFSSRSFTNIQGAGFYVENDVVNTTEAPSVNVSQFSVNALIPEPSSISLLGAAGLVLMARRNRKG